jgi:ribosomal protein S1
MKNNIVLIAILSLLVGGGAGFFGGMQYQKSQRPASFARVNRTRNGGGVVGDILSADNNSVTVKLPDGSSKIVLLTAATSINKAATAAASDLTVGETVSAFGTTNTDGSITATNVQINPGAR